MVLAYKLLRSADSKRDLELIFDHLMQSYQAFGETLEASYERAASRVTSIEDQMHVIAKTPHQGTKRSDIIDGLRNVTKNNAIYYFHVDDDAKTVKILAVFFGGQDHIRHMLTRLPPPYQ